jgi:hypothetical protein
MINFLSEIRRSSVLNTARADGRVRNEGGVRSRDRKKSMEVLSSYLYEAVYEAVYYSVSQGIC